MKRNTKNISNGDKSYDLPKNNKLKKIIYSNLLDYRNCLI